MNKLTKYIALSTFAVSSLTLVGCGKSNTNKELAKKIEAESTELIYSIESMDSIRLSDLDDETVAANATYTISSYSVLTENLSPSQKRMQGANPKKYQNKTSNNQSESASKTNSNDIASATSSKSNSSNAVQVASESKTESKKQTALKLTTNDFGDADEYSKELVSKRSEVMLLCSKLRKGDIKLSKDELSRVNECIELVNDTAEYLENSKGKIEKEYKSAKTTAEKVAVREKLAIRQAKLQTGILAMDEIIGIMDKTKSQSKAQTTSTTKESNTTAKKSSSSTKTNKEEKATTQNTTKTSSEKQNKTKTNQTTNKITNQTRTAQTENQTNTQENDAVSIVVQPVKTQPINTTNQNQQSDPTSEYIVRRPRNVSKIYNNMPVFSATAMPEPLPKTSTVPYHSAQNVGYSA